MKIGILTYHRAHNYGALLQAYALKKNLEKNGDYVEMVDYWPNYHVEDYKLIPFFKSRRFLSKGKSLLLLMLGFRRVVKRRNSYKEFINKEFGLTEQIKFSSHENLSGVDYDVVVYGSDQIWRKSDYPTFKGFSNVFYGGFIPKSIKKITYAASMGIIDVDQDDENYLTQMLTNFDRISVRELGLKNLVEQLSTEKIELVLDPVFLLDRKEWENLGKSTYKIPSEKYIFFYQLVASPASIKYVNELAAHHNLKIVEIRGRVDPLKFGSRYFQTGGPNDFLSLIKNAEIVVSTSFHGVAFSLIFEKQFYALGIGKNSERVVSLLNNLGISERYLTKDRYSPLDNRINYKEINKILALLIESSKKYLNTAVYDAK